MLQSIFSLEGRTALVTGAAGARGIGRATALALARAGADVVVADIHLRGDDFDLEGSADLVRQCGRRALGLPVDIADRQSVDDLFQKAVAEFGGLDILVNNAALGAMAAYSEVTREQWDRTMETNLRGCHNCCQAASKIMIGQKRGNIINISSTSGFRYTPNQYAYGVSKAGILQITRWLSKELVAHHIRVNCVAPGMVETDINQHDIAGKIKTAFPRPPGAAGGPSGPPGLVLPFGRICQPEDIANAVLFLACDASAYISGQVIVVDGGMSG
jgi:3-oxoacyl-[acyl-carrier protein] reductase